MEARVAELENEIKNGSYGLFEQMEMESEVHDLKMKINGIKPTNSEFECFGCGS